MKKIVFYLISVLCFTGIYGQDTISIREVIVEEKAGKNAVQEQKEAGPSSFVVSSKDLNNLGHKTAGDVLRRMPRIIMQGPPSFNRNIMMAGLEKEFQSVLINGNRPAGGEDSRDFKLDRLPLAMIEKIEVTYNPPVDMGADATIGAVNIILKETPEEQVINAFVNFDNTSTLSGINPEVGLAYGNKWDKFSLYANINSNKFQRQNIKHVSDTVNTGTEVEDIDVFVNGINLAMAYEPDSTRKWKFQSVYTNYYETLLRVADIKRRTQGGLNLRADTSDDTKNRILHSQTLGYERRTKRIFWETDLIFAQHFDSKDRWRTQEKSDYVEQTLEDEFQTNSELILRSDLSYKLNTKGFENTLKLGVKASALDRDYDRMVYTKAYGDMFWADITDGSYTLNEYRLGVYAGDEIKLKKWWIYPAVRTDFDKGNYTVVGQDDGNMEYFNVSPSIHTKYFLTDDLFLKADIARQIARPPFNLMVPVDKVKNRKEVIERGNPDLVPSIANNFSLGVEKYFTTKSFITLRGFYSVLRDVVEYNLVGIDDELGYNIIQPVNIDSGLIWGIDFGTRCNLLNNTYNDLSFWGNVSWLGSEVRDPGTKELRKLSDQPDWIINGSIDYLNTKLKFQCSIGINYIGERITSSTISDEVVIDEITQSRYMQWDARFKYFYSVWGSVYINFINIFDETIDYTQGAVSESEVIGRNIVIGTSLNF